MQIYGTKRLFLIRTLTINYPNLSLLFPIFYFFIRQCLIDKNFLFFVFKLFENKKNTFSYENKTKTNFENKDNEFAIFNILYINQKTVLCCFTYFRIKSKTRNLIDWDKMKTSDSYFLLFISLLSSTSIFFSLGS